MPREDFQLLRLPEATPWHYCQAVKVGNLIFVAGQVGREGDITAQAQQAYESVRSVLAQAGATMDQVVKETVYLTDAKHLADVARVRLNFYNDPHFPASTMVHEISVAGRYLIEVEVIASLDA